jgi:hypothetical protein
MRCPWPTGSEGIRFRGTVIELAVTAQLSVDDAETIPLPAQLSYNPELPFGVLLRFPQHEERIAPWWFARSLLRTGTQSAAGEGDVRVWPWQNDGRSWLRVRLQGTEAAAVLDLPSRPVGEWLAATLIAVPEEMESDLICWDSVLETLLSDG